CSWPSPADRTSAVITALSSFITSPPSTRHDVTNTPLVQWRATNWLTDDELICARPDSVALGQEIAASRHPLPVQLLAQGASIRVCFPHQGRNAGRLPCPPCGSACYSYNLAIRHPAGALLFPLVNAGRQRFFQLIQCRILQQFPKFADRDGNLPAGQILSI